VLKKYKKFNIKIEEYITLILIISSFFITSPSEYFVFFHGEIIISKYTIAFTFLFILSVLTTLYKNRIQRIIDTIKSGVKIPEVTIEDQIIHFLKNKGKILLVIRDYLPFVLCMLAFSSIKNLSTILNHTSIEPWFINAEQILINNIREYVNSLIEPYKIIKNILTLSYNTYTLSVPILAIYLHLTKKFSAFREFMLAIIISNILGLTINITLYGPNSVSFPVAFTSIVLFFSLTVSPKLTLFYMPIAILLCFADILNFSHYFISILIGIVIGIVSIPVSKLLIKLDRQFINRRKY